MESKNHKSETESDEKLSKAAKSDPTNHQMEPTVRQRAPRGTEKSAEPKLHQRAPKGSQREPEVSEKGAQREPRNDQNASKNRYPKKTPKRADRGDEVNPPQRAKSLKNHWFL